MHGGFKAHLTWMLAIAMAGGVTTAVQGQTYVPVAPGNMTESMPVDPSRAPMLAANENAYVADNYAPQDSALAARVAELEKALKKVDDKSKADKEKAASAMTCTPSGAFK